MKEKNLERKVSESIDEIEVCRRLYEGVPMRATVKVKRCKRYSLRGGLPLDELERISVLRVWAPIAGLPRDPKSPDDFEPPLPEWEGLGV
jgi:hypothetical protein